MATTQHPSNSELVAFAIGLSQENRAGQTIDCYFPAPLRSPGSWAISVRLRPIPA